MPYHRPPFWRVPLQRRDPDDDEPRRHTRPPQVTPGSPAGRELLRGDIIAKIDDYDARDLRHEDAQNLFKNAPNQIRIVVQRDADREGPRGAPLSPRSPLPASAISPSSYRSGSPRQAPSSSPYPPSEYEGSRSTLLSPTCGEYRSALLSPTSARSDDTLDEALHNQPYRTTPLVLPGAKVRREPGPTESYLRHHPNPAMRAPPHHDYRDTLMKQKVAESVLQRVVGDEANNKLAHKQYNSPINLYSEQNIANSVRQQTSPLPSNGLYGRPHVVKSHRPTLLYDPARSETYRALQEDGAGAGEQLQEVATPALTKVFTAPPNKRPAPTPKPALKQPETKPNGKQTTFVNSLHEEQIQQSNSFKRLMYNVLGE